MIFHLPLPLSQKRPNIFNFLLIQARCLVEQIQSLRPNSQVHPVVVGHLTLLMITLTCPQFHPVAVGHLGLLLTTNLNCLQVHPMSVGHLWYCMKFAQVPALVIYKSCSPVSCTQSLICDLVGLVTKFPARERDQNYKMADEKYSEVVELLRRAESLLSPNPSTNNQQVTNATAGPSTSRPSTNPSGASEGGMAWDDGPVLFNNKVLESYPKLKDTGGYELLRSGPVPKKLTVVAPP